MGRTYTVINVTVASILGCRAGVDVHTCVTTRFKPSRHLPARLGTKHRYSTDRDVM